MEIVMYDLEGHFLEVFDVDTFVELEKQLNIPQGSLNACVNGKQTSVNGKQFRKRFSKILTKIGDVRGVKVGQSYNPVHKYYKGRFICSYQNIRIAAIDNDLDETGISRCCSGKSATCGGYEWRTP